MQANSPFRQQIQSLVDARARLRAKVDDEEISFEERKALWDALENLDRRIGHTFFWYSVHMPSSIIAVPPSGVLGEAIVDL